MVCSWTETAEVDIDNIFHYIASEALSTAPAESLLTDIYDLVELLTRHPQMGRLREEFSEGLRSLSTGNYIIFYFEDENDITIAPIVDGRRNLRKILKHVKR